VPPPDLESRKEIFRIHLKQKPLAKDISIDDLAAKTEGYTGADIESVTETAVMNAIRRFISMNKDDKESSKKLDQLIVTKDDFEQAMKKVRPLARSDLIYESRKPSTTGHDISAIS